MKLMKHEPMTSKPSSETQGQLVGATGFSRAKVFAPTSCPWVVEDASMLEKAKKNKSTHMQGPCRNKQKGSSLSKSQEKWRSDL